MHPPKLIPFKALSFKTKAREPRPGRIIDRLTAEQIRDLRDWLLKGETYSTAQRRFPKKFRIHISTGTLHRFWQKVCAPLAPRFEDALLARIGELVVEIRVRRLPEQPGNN